MQYIIIVYIVLIIFCRTQFQLSWILNMLQGTSVGIISQVIYTYEIDTGINQRKTLSI